MSNDRHLVLATIDENERPLSIRTLGAYAESIGVKVTLLVLIKELAGFGHPVTFSESEVKQIASFLEREKVTHLGFYLMTAGLNPYRKLVLALRERGYRGVIMAGGVHPALCPEESLVEGADYAVSGPGELPLKAILNCDDPSTIPGLVWRKDGKVTVNPQSPSQKLDLDTLPPQIFRFDHDWIMVDGKLRRLTWKLHREWATWNGEYYDMITSRGCVNKCAYCCNVSGAPVRRQSVDRVIDELVALRKKEPRIKGINFQDDSFYIGSDEWLDKFCSRMKAEVGLPFIIRLIPKFVTPARVELLKSAGLQYVTMGLQTSDRVNRTIFNRHETSQSVINAAKVVLGAGIYLSIDLITHNPYEKENDLRDVATTLNSLPRPNWGIVANPLTVFPNTPLYARCKKDGMLDSFSTDPYEAMLVPSKPGGYLTPDFWLLVNVRILLAVPPNVGAKLIAMDPSDPKAVLKVQTFAKRLRRLERVSKWVSRNLPTVNSAVSVLYKATTKRRKV